MWVCTRYCGGASSRPLAGVSRRRRANGESYLEFKWLRVVVILYYTGLTEAVRRISAGSGGMGLLIAGAWQESPTMTWRGVHCSISRVESWAECCSFPGNGDRERPVVSTQLSIACRAVAVDLGSFGGWSMRR